MHGYRNRKLAALNLSAAVWSASISLLLWTHVQLVSCEELGPIRTLSVPLQRRGPASMGPGPLSRRLAGETGHGTVMVQDCENSEYSGPIGLGTPVREFQVVFDTGSAALWVTSVDCTEDCDVYNNKYDSSLSSTYEADGTRVDLRYEDGSEAIGYLSSDILSVGGLSARITFGEMETRKLDGCGVVDGIMGMGTALEGDSQSAFEDLVEAGVVDVPIFSFFMGNIDTDTPRGVLTLGGVNQTHYEGCLEWIDTISDPLLRGYWGVEMKDVKIGSHSVLAGPAAAILDTGTSMIVGPYEDIGYIAAHIGAFCIKFIGISSSDFTTVDCINDASEVELVMMECPTTFDDINFYFGGDDFPLTPTELLLPLTDFLTTSSPPSSANDWCLFGMMGHDSNLWILGDSFLRTFYSAYDVQNDKVGLAQSAGKRTTDFCEADANITASDDATPAPTPEAPPTAPPEASPTAPPAASPTPAVTSSSEAATTASSSQAEGDDDSGGPAPVPPSPSEPSGEQATTQGGDADDEDPSAESEGRFDMKALVFVAVATSAGTLVIFCMVAGTVVTLRRCCARRNHIRLGSLGNGGFEMSAKNAKRVGGMGPGGNAAPGAEDDFLQVEPGAYSDNGSGSHVYRVGGDVVTGTADNGSPTDGDGEDEEVEVDFAGNTGQSSAGAVASQRNRGGPLGRLFGPGRAGFSAVDESKETMMEERADEHTGSS